jgi:hypothetical protein
MKTNRVRWFQARIPCAFEDVYQQFKSNQYTHEFGSGFEVLDYGSRALSARYMEKIIEKSVLINPFGEEEVVETVLYCVVEFKVVSIDKGRFIFKVVNAPKSIKRFVDKLYTLFAFGFVIDQMKFNVARFYDHFVEELKPNRLLIKKAKVSGVPLGDKSTARMEITSLSNAYEEFMLAYKDSKYHLDKICMSLRLSGCDALVEVSSSGAMRYPACIETDIDEFVISNATAICLNEFSG